MPKYFNTASYPIFYNDVIFTPGEPVEILDVLNNQAFIFGTIGETYAINAGVNDILKIRFNDETVWTTVTLTAGGAQTANNIVDDINIAYGSIVAFNEAGRLKIIAPRESYTLSAVWLDSTVGGSTANNTLGLIGHKNNPSGLSARQVFLNSTQLQMYNITSANNTFIFKFNETEDWITATLTTGAARTAQQVADDINEAYRIATGEFMPVARAVELITGSGNIQLQLVAPVFDNYQSEIYIGTFNNTALAVLGFDSDDIFPLIMNGHPQLIQQEILPLYNPFISRTVITFPGGGWTTFYINTDSNEFQFKATATAVDIYIEDLTNIPPIVLAAGDTFTLNYNKNVKINKFIIQAAGAGNLTIFELKS